MDLADWAKKYGPVVGIATGLIAIGTFAATVGRSLFAPPRVGITTATTPLQFPFYLYRDLGGVLARDSARLSDSSKATLARLRSFILGTENFTRVTITNNSGTGIEHVQVRVRGVLAADGYAIESDALDDSERRALLDSIHFDPPQGLLTLRTIPRLPARSALSLYVWGELSFANIFDEEQVSAYFDGGKATPVQERTVRGLDAFIYDNAGLLLVIIILLNVAAWSYGLEFLKRRLDRQNPSHS